MTTLDFDLRVLRYFVAVAEERHFGKAALRLHVSQPALSAQIRRFEHLLGLELFLRTSRKVELTPAGEVLHTEARRVLEAGRRALEAARSAAAGQRGRLVVGFLANAAADLTPVILGEFQEQHPLVDVEMRQFDFADPLGGLGDGVVDVAFLRPPILVQNWLATETLFVEPRVLILSSRNSLASEKEVSVAQLVDEPFVARRAPSYWRDYWLAADLRNGSTIRVGAETATVDECLEAVLMGQGIAFTQKSSERFYARPGLSFVPVSDITPSSVVVAWRRDAETPLVTEFVETARRVATASDWMPDCAMLGETALAVVGAL